MHAKPFAKRSSCEPTSRLPRSTWERRGSWRAITPAVGPAIDTHGELRKRSLPRDLPEWNGVPIPGKSLLVYADQGFGDTIQFAISLHLSRTIGRTDRLVLPVGTGQSVCRATGCRRVLANEEPVSDCDFQVPIASLPGLLGVTIESVGIGVPYLSPPRDLRWEIAALFEQVDHDAVRIGLVWQGNPKQMHDMVGSCPLEKLEPLLNTNRARFFNLQTGEPGRLQINDFKLRRDRLTDVGGSLANFADTAPS